MSSITNVNSNSSVVNVGRTTPVSPGPQTAEKSIPVVMASDQTAIPVVEQNKVQSEVALSLLGIPRAEVALGIFADVNTYDVNPSEWSMKPEYHIDGHGVKHLPTEAGALVEAPRNETSVLTSKRFFRYQPGRVSAATFGIRSSVSLADFAQNPAIRKYGIYDKYDGYYWETRNSGVDDNFSVVRRTQSVAYSPVTPYGIKATTLLRGNNNTSNTTVATTQTDDYRAVGNGASEALVSEGLLSSDRQIVIDKKFDIVDSALAVAYKSYYQASSANFNTYNNGGTGTAISPVANSGDLAATGFATQNEYRYYTDLAAAINADNGGITDITALEVRAKCKRDLDYWIDNFLLDMKHGGKAHTVINTSNFALSNGTSDWYSIKVGIFPKVSRFEKPVHQALKLIFKTGKLFQDSDTTAGTGSVGALGTPTGTDLNLSAEAIAFVGADTTGLAAITQTAFTDDDFYAGLTSPTALVTADYGTGVNAKSKLDTFFDVKMNFWAYWVTTKTATGVRAYDAATQIQYSIPAGGLSSLAALGYTNNAAGQAKLKAYLKYKCQRDVGYIIDGYKNDILGGGNAETIYNASMFLRGTGLSVYSQQGGGSNNDGNISEPERHAHLKTRIQNDLKTFGFADSTSEYVKLTSLADHVIANFDVEKSTAMSVGDRGFAGNLVALRDGLIHTHAAVYDPSLLKPAKKIIARVTSGTVDGTDPCVFKLTEGYVTFGQHIKIHWTGNGTVLDTDTRNGEVLTVTSVFGPKGCEFTAKDAVTGVAVTPTQNQINSASIGTISITTVVPFIFPKDYNVVSSDATTLNNFASKIDVKPSKVNNKGALVDGTDAREFRTYSASFDTGLIPKGPVFPYMYSAGDDLNATANFYEDEKYVGFINTALNPSITGEGGTAASNVDTIRSQIDNVNFFPEYINWIKNNVDPKYYGVYEYRVPRSRFSHDALDGIAGLTTDNPKTAINPGRRNRVYSDLATGSGGIARPGENYTVTDNTPEYQQSAYKFDFTKVTMLKVEFSWYGAVGALFLAYVPVGNGEARWVRVHHLRASNQLKIASLGNATLPITYTTYGGGSQYCLGDGEDGTIQQGYGTFSHNIVKYGASYYIDGGDRGTVRLYSYNNDAQVDALGKQFAQGGAYVAADTVITGSTLPSIVVDAVDKTTSTDLIDPRFYMGATVKTSSRLDQNIKVVWADPDSGKVFLSAPLSSSTSMKLLPDRAETVYGLETKQVILSTREGNSVRNRVQVYPTKLSASNSSGENTVRLRFKKTPIFQSNIMSAGKLDLSADYTITSAKTALAVTETVTTGNLANTAFNNNVVTAAAHPFSSGEAVKYSHGGGTTVTNLVDGTTYFVRKISANTFELYGTEAQALADLNVTTGRVALSTSGSGSAHTLVSATGGFLANGQDIYGWFRGRVEAENVTVFGRLYKETDLYYFEPQETFEGTVVLTSGAKDFFLPDLRFSSDGDQYGSAVTKNTSDLEGLSSIKIANDLTVPIPDTGSNVATIYLQQGTEQFDLSTYFDYNKEYLSFPLTDVADSLYFAVDADTAHTSNDDPISLGVTWEEQ